MSWLTLIALGTSAAATAAVDADRLLKDAGIARGVAYVPACGDGALALELAEKSELLVLATDPDPANVAQAKARAAAAGLLGRRLYVQQGAPDAIPFADHYVDLLARPGTAEKDLGAAARAEILRVLTPVRGRAVLADTTIRKPGLPGADGWAHKLHGPDNNPVSQDRAFAFPPILQYRALPSYTAAHGASVTANGIHFEINDWLFKSPTRANLSGRITVRSAYNGQILWEDFAPENTIASTPIVAATDTELLMASGDRPEVERWEAATGRRLAPIVLGGAEQRVRWLAHQGGVLYALLGGPAEIKPPFSFYVPAVMSQWQGHSLFGTELVAWDPAAGAAKWRHTEPVPIDYRNVAVHGNRLCFYSEKTRLACLDAADGKLKWENKDGDWLEKLIRPPQPHNVFVGNVSSLIVADGLVRLAVAECQNMFLFDAEDGHLLSRVAGSAQKSLIVDGALYVGTSGFNARTGEKIETALPTKTGLAWCGLVTYAPYAGLIGHSTLGYKSACAVGAWVAGGLLIYSPTVCDCGAVTGTGTFSGGGGILRRIREQPDHPLVKGEAFERVQGSGPSRENGDWTAYRGGSAHRGSSPASVPATAAIAWTAAPDHPFSYSTLYNQFVTAFDERPVPPIVVGATVFTAGTDGLVSARALADGKSLWTFSCDGPVLTPPAWSGGGLYVPCADGWVYALDAESGKLAWKRRLAPMERRILLFGQLASNWPVLSLMVDDGTVYASAGHAVTDGVKTFALDAKTGDIAWSHYDEPAAESFQGSHNPPDRPVQGCGGAMTRAGERVWTGGFFSPPLTLDRRTGEDHLFPLKRKLVGPTSFIGYSVTWYMRGQDLVALDDRNVLAGGGDLFDNQQLHEGKRRRTAYKLYAVDDRGDWVLDPAPPDVFVSRIAPACDDRMVVYAAPSSYEVVKGEKRARRGFDVSTSGLTAWDRDAFLKAARAMQKASPTDRDRTAKDPAGRIFMENPSRVDLFGSLEDDPVLWRKPDLDVCAIALASNAVVAAHASAWENLYTWSSDTLAKREALLKYEGWKVSAFARDTGGEIWSVALSSEPLRNGLAVAADGTVVVALRDGGIVHIQAAGLDRP
jgi:outer membrane protein assembly factor BamB